ncbi:Mismatch repair endonuclease pms2, partial [Actinomortierella wolfii]
IKFKQQGLELLSVSDNGSGVTDENLDVLALKHYTSKLSDFSDLATVESFGFRGEALSSLCALARLSVTTSTGKNPMGVKVDYNADGVPGPKTPVPFPKGTCVTLTNLFEGMPVRRSEFVKNIKREFAKCLGLIQAYALISTNVRIKCTSQTDKKSTLTHLATTGNTSIRQNIVNIFGAKGVTDLVELNLTLVEPSTDAETGQYNNSRPDKRTIFLHNERMVVEELREKLTQKFEPSRSTFSVSEAMIKKPDLSAFKRTVDTNTRDAGTLQTRHKKEDDDGEEEDAEESLIRNKATSLLARGAGRELAAVETIVGKTAEIRVTEQQRNVDEYHDPVEVTMSSPTVHSTTTKQVSATHASSSTASTRKYMVEEITLGSISSPGGSSNKQQTNLHKHFSPAVPTNEAVAGTKRPLETDDDGDMGVSVEDSVHIAKPSGAQKPTDAIIDDHNESTTSAHPPTGSTDAVKMDAQLDGRQDSITNEGVEDIASEEEEEEEEDDDNNRLASKAPQDRRVHRIVVLDSEVHQDGDREWVEVDFDAKEQLQKRKIRMQKLKEKRRQLEEQEAKARERRLRLAKLRKAEKEKESTATASASAVESDEVDMTEEDHAGQVEGDDSEMNGTSRKSRRLQEARDPAKKKKEAQQRLSDASFANTDDAKARRSLSRVISKKDFARMKVLGQFNKAFIIARLDSTEVVEEESDEGEDNDDSEMAEASGEAEQRPKRATTSSVRTRSDIFVIDQHASDEKYNFETLQAKTAMSTQRLFQPKPLYLTAQEELTVLDNMDILNKNGFYLHHDQDAPVSHRLKLLTLPVSERVVFDQSDFEELVFLLSQQEHSSVSMPSSSSASSESSSNSNQKENGSSDSATSASSTHVHHAHHKMVRPSKVRNLFASRACRRSVMIGDVLKVSKMKKIVRHMGEIDQPWNCPHGRPTMRHLLDLSELEHHQSQVRSSSLFAAATSSSASATTSSALADVWDPISIKRPTQHRGSLFRQFMAAPPTA